MRLAVGQSPFFYARANHPLDWESLALRTPNNRFTISLAERGTAFNGLPDPPGCASRVDHEFRTYAFGLTGGR